MSTVIDERQKYLRNAEIRAEIAYAVGCDPTRYRKENIGHDNVCFRKAHVKRIAQALQPADSDARIEGVELPRLYELVCQWAGGEYHRNHGNAWGMNRDNLKKIHRALEARPPEEVLEV